MCEFKDAANRKDHLISSFGVNSYLTILTYYSINFALDYQNFLFRSKLDINPDSLLLPVNNYSFSDWDCNIYSSQNFREIDE
jgi:hypothetical protein